jgi:WD40 repeat protein
MYIYIYTSICRYILVLVHANMTDKQTPAHQNHLSRTKRTSASLSDSVTAHVLSHSLPRRSRRLQQQQPDSQSSNTIHAEVKSIAMTASKDQSTRMPHVHPRKRRKQSQIPVCDPLKSNNDPSPASRLTTSYVCELGRSTTAGHQARTVHTSTDMLSVVFEFLRPCEVLMAACVCRAWKIASQKDFVWRAICKQLGLHRLMKATTAAAAQHSTGALATTLKPIRKCDHYKIFRDHVSAFFSTQPSRRVCHSFEHSRPIRCMTFDPVASQLFTGAQDKTLVQWTRRTDQSFEMSKCFRAKTSVNSMHLVRGACSQPDLLLAGTAGRTSECILFNLIQNSVTHSTSDELVSCARYSGHVDSVFCCQGDADAQRIATGGGQNDKTVRLFDMSTEACLTVLPHRGSVRSLVLAPFAATLWSGALDNWCRLWDTRSGECELEFRPFNAGVHAMDIDGYNLALTSGRPENAVCIYDTRMLPTALTGDVRHSHRSALIFDASDHKSAVSCLSFQAGMKLVAGSYDGTVSIHNLFDMPSGGDAEPAPRCLNRISGFGRINSIASVGNVLAIGDESLHVFEFQA